LLRAQDSYPPAGGRQFQLASGPANLLLATILKATSVAFFVSQILENKKKVMN